MHATLRMPAALLSALLAIGCETDADWVGANPGRLDYWPTQILLADCDGRNGPEWKRLEIAPPDAEVYMLHAEKAAQPNEIRRIDRWYHRGPGEVLLCRSVKDSDIGGYEAYWRFREHEGRVVVAESYAWQYVVAN
ncbi:MAG: hypothetical protein QM773_02780 [Hyphomonadaceae bacterium]